MYRFLRPALFALDAERAHEWSLRAWDVAAAVPLVARTLGISPVALPTRVMGIDFPNPVGLAAGLDKNAAHIAGLSHLGFGWLELGTVTPRPQAGNPRKRLFRLVAEEALINRMGFNNVGLDAFLRNLQSAHAALPLGINIGKNRDTPLERALDDYVAGFKRTAPLAAYIAINISSPNTADLRRLQDDAALDALLHALKDAQAGLPHYTPLAIKIAPDLSPDALSRLAQQLLKYRVDAVIATNTTVTRPLPVGTLHGAEAGGLSGRPLKSLALQAVRTLYAELQGRIPIIGVGGLFDAEDCWERLCAGADLVQLYSALIYRGPRLVSDVVRKLQAKVMASGHTELAQALRAARRNQSSAHYPK